VRQILHGLRIFKRQLFADPQFLGRRPEGNRQVEGKNNVRPHAADHAADVVVQSAHDRRNADDHGDADHDPSTVSPERSLFVRMVASAIVMIHRIRFDRA